MTSHYLEGLLYKSNGDSRPEETKTGIPLFDGTPHHFEKWKMRVQAKLAAAELAPEDKREHERANLSPRILDGLTDDVANIAQEYGHEKLIAKDGAAGLLVLMETEIIGFC